MNADEKTNEKEQQNGVPNNDKDANDTINWIAQSSPAYADVDLIGRNLQLESKINKLEISNHQYKEYVSFIKYIYSILILRKTNHNTYTTYEIIIDFTVFSKSTSFNIIM